MPQRKSGILLNVIFVSLILSAFGLVGAKTALAQEENFTQIDIVLLLDQSQSILKSDPDSIRHEAARFALNWSRQILFEYDKTEDRVEVNLGVIFFGERAEVILPLQSVGKLTNNDPESLALSIENLDKAAQRFKNIHFTEFASALDAADAMFSETQASSSVNRHQIAVLITDGIPDSRDIAGQVDARDQEQLGRLYQTEIRKAEKRLPVYDIYLLRVPATSQRLWQQVEAAWQDVLGADRVYIVSDTQTMGSELQEILSTAVSKSGILPDTRLKCGPFKMPAYVDTAYFTVHKPTPQSRVRLLDPLGRDVAQINWKERTGSVESAQTSTIGNIDGFIESVAVFNPTPGSWQLLCPVNVVGNVPVYMRTSMLHGVLDVIPTLMGIPSQLIYQLLAHDGSPLPGYETESPPLEVSVTIAPSDQPRTATLNREPGSNRYQTIVTLPESTSLQYQVFLPGGADASELLEEASRAIDMQAVYYRWKQIGDITQFAAQTAVVEIVNEQGEPLNIPPAVGNTLALHVTTDQGADFTLKATYKENHLWFQNPVSFYAGGAHLLTVDLMNKPYGGGSIRLQPWNGENQILVYSPTLKPSASEVVPIFVPVQVSLEPVDHNSDPLPNDILNYAQLPVTASLSGSVLPLLHSARWDADEGVYRLWVFPYTLASQATLRVRWDLPGIQSTLEPISAQLPTTNPMESYSKYYIIPSIVLAALLILILSGIWAWRERRLFVPRAGGYLMLRTEHGKYYSEPSRKRHFVWKPDGHAGGINRVVVYQEEDPDGTNMFVTVEDINGYAILRNAPIRMDGKLDVGPNQFIQRLPERMYEEVDAEKVNVSGGSENPPESPNIFDNPS